MPVYDVTDWSSDDDERYLRPPARCFWCGKVLSADLLVYVIGKRPSHYAKASPQLWVHPDCALQLADVLARDVVQLRKILLQKT
jgi:hypothetical protein